MCFIIISFRHHFYHSQECNLISLYGVHPSYSSEPAGVRSFVMVLAPLATFARPILLVPASGRSVHAPCLIGQGAYDPSLQTRRNVQRPLRRYAILCGNAFGSEPVWLENIIKRK